MFALLLLFVVCSLVEGPHTPSALTGLMHTDNVAPYMHMHPKSGDLPAFTSGFSCVSTVTRSPIRAYKQYYACTFREATGDM